MWRTFIWVDNVRALVAMGELGRCREVREIVLPKFDVEYAEACLIEGEDALTLRLEEKKNTETLRKHKANPQIKNVTAVVPSASPIDWRRSVVLTCTKVLKGSVQ